MLRLKKLFDNGEFTVLNGEMKHGVNTGYGYVNGRPVYAFSQDVSVNNGAVGLAHADKICRVLELSAKNGTPVVGIYDSNGAFVQDGAAALSAYSKILSLTNNLSGVVPLISVVAGSCLGSSALIACSADIVVKVKDADLYMNATDENVNGGVSVNADDEDSAFETVRNILALLPQNNMGELPEVEYDNVVTSESIADTDSEIELLKDFGDNASVTLATVEGSVVGMVKTADNGVIGSDDCSKIARFVRFCDAFSIPVLTLIDTDGFSGNVRDLSKLSNAYAEAGTLKIAIVTGHAYGSAMVAFGADNADVTYAYGNAVIAPLNPVTAVEFLYHDKLKGAKDLTAKREELAAEYAKTEVSALKAAELGVISGVITPSEARGKVISAINVMSNKRLFKRLPKKHSNIL